MPACSVRRFGALRSSVMPGAEIAVVAMIAGPSAYLALITVAGLTSRRARTASTMPTTRFAILVPAHNEEVGIGETLEAFEALAYPSELFAVHVVADNCTDRTATLVQHSPWEVHERHDPTEPGKGPALNWLLDRLICRGDAFDAVIVVDADTSLDPHFLRAMDAAYSAGEVAAQGNYSVRDPEASAAASFRYAALACRHHLRPLGRMRVGGSCGLFGNGMMFRRDVLVRHRWSNHLVEDAELQNELLLEGHLVAYVPDAMLWAEMPDDMRQATSQNERWERGRVEVARRFVPQLLAGIGAARGRRIARLDAVADHLLPPLSALAAVQLVVGAVSVPGALAGHRRSRRVSVAAALSLTLLIGHVFAGLASVGAPRSLYRALLTAPKFVLWKAMMWARVVTSGDQAVEWVRTTRNDEVTR